MASDEKQIAELSYTEMSTDPSGQIVPRHKKESARRELGYCLSCPHIPTLLFDVRRPKLNPLARVKKTPLNISGLCFEGICLKCFPDKKKRHASESLTGSSSFKSTHSTANCSAASSDDSDGSPLELSRAEGGSMHDPQDKPKLQTRKGTRRSTSSHQHRSDYGTPSLSRTQPSRTGRGSSNTFSGNSEQAPPLSSVRSHDGLWPTSGTTCRTTPSRRSLGPSTSEPLRPSSLSTARPLTRSLSDGSEDDPVHFSPLIRRGSGPRQCSEHFSSTRRNQRIVRRDPLQSKEKHIVHGCSSSSLRDADIKVGVLKAFFREVKETKCPQAYSESILASMKEHKTWEKGQIVCCRHLFRAIGTDEICEEHFVRLGGHQTTLETANFFGGSRQIQELCCEIVFGLAKIDNVRMALIGEGSCEFVIRNLMKEIANDKLIISALGSLRIFSTLIQARQQLLQYDTTNVVLDVMACNPLNLAVQRDGCAVIANMAYENGEILTLDKTVIKAAADALSNNPLDSCVVSSASFTLNNLSFNKHNLRVIAHLPGLSNTLETTPEITAQELLEKIHLMKAEDESLAIQRY